VQDFNARVLGGAADRTFTYSVWIKADAALTLRISPEDRVSGNYQNTSTYASDLPPSSAHRIIRRLAPSLP
jgi:hypothetical protein